MGLTMVVCIGPFLRLRDSIGGRGPSREPHMGGEGGNWIDVRPRCGKALRQGDGGWDRLREAHWFDGRDDFDFCRSRFRYATREGRFSRERSWDSSSLEIPYSSQSRYPSREDEAADRRWWMIVTKVQVRMG